MLPLEFRYGQMLTADITDSLKNSVKSKFLDTIFLSIESFKTLS